MASDQLSQRPFLVLGAAVVVHVILISAQVTTRTGVPLLQVATFGAFAELQRVTMTTVSSVRGVWTDYVDLTAVQQENAALRRENQTLRVRLQEERAVAQRTESLRQLLELRERAGVETIAAEVIGAAPAPDVRSYSIDKGSSDGVRKDMAAISPAGVVGRVILPSARAAQVQLLIDRNAAAAALIERTRAQGIVLGQHSDTLVMEYVPGTADVRRGDLVVTSGIDGIYPKGFVIGTVELVERGPGSFHRISVRPAVDFSRLEEVLIVTTPTSIKAAEAAEAALATQRGAGAAPPSSTQTPAGASGNQSPRPSQPDAPASGAGALPGTAGGEAARPVAPRGQTTPPDAGPRVPSRATPSGNQSPRQPGAEGTRG